MTRALVAATLVLASGCSLALVRRAGPEPEPAVWPHCTEHKLFPLVDTAYAVLAGALTVSAATDKSTYGGLGLLISLPMLVGFGGSALYGWSGTSHCAAVREAYEAAAAQGR